MTIKNALLNCGQEIKLKFKRSTSTSRSRSQVGYAQIKTLRPYFLTLSTTKINQSIRIFCLGVFLSSANWLSVVENDRNPKQKYESLHFNDLLSGIWLRPADPWMAPVLYSLDSVICWLCLLAITAAPQDALLHVSLIFMPEYSVRLLKVRCGK